MNGGLPWRNPPGWRNISSIPDHHKVIKTDCPPGPPGSVGVSGDPGYPGFPGVKGVKGEAASLFTKPSPSEECRCFSGPQGKKGTSLILRYLFKTAIFPTTITIVLVFQVKLENVVDQEIMAC